MSPSLAIIALRDSFLQCALPACRLMSLPCWPHAGHDGRADVGCVSTSGGGLVVLIVVRADPHETRGSLANPLVHEVLRQVLLGLVSVHAPTHENLNAPPRIVQDERRLLSPLDDSENRGVEAVGEHEIGIVVRQFLACMFRHATTEPPPSI